MELLFKREQSELGIGSVNFRLWGKIELNEGEQEIVKRYKFDESMLIEVDQPNLLRNAIFAGLFFAAVIGGLLSTELSMNQSLAIGLASGTLGSYFFYHNRRETIYVKDLLHGRYFSCKSVVELARKEAWLEYVVGFLRQVMESAKHWDGTQRHTVEPLPKDEARQVIIRGL